MVADRVQLRVAQFGREWARRALGADLIARMPEVSAAITAILRGAGLPDADLTREALWCADAVAAGYWADRARRNGSASLGELARNLGVSVQALRVMIRMAIADSDGLLDSPTAGLPVGLTEALRRLTVDYSAAASVGSCGGGR